MLLSAAKLALVLVSVSVSGQDGLAPPLSPALAQHAQQRTLVLRAGEEVVGEAVLIDSNGSALTTLEAAKRVASGAVVGENASISVAYTVRRTDPVSGLALLAPAQAVQGAPYAALASSATQGIGLAVVPEGAVRVGITRVNLPGAVGPNRVYSPLTEVRFEARSSNINGAPVFDANGLLVGILSSALESPNPAATEIGPAPPVVAFSVGTKTLARAVATLQDRNNLSHHPYIGVRYGDSTQGVVILSVSAPSPASAVGLKEGELIRRAGQRVVDSALDVAEYLYSLEPGEMAVFSVESRGIQRTVIVPVGRYPAAGQAL
ncbi:MAG: hypothetical protein KatS3mg015_2053 [Fimbriimonadales bacterium]|nr:MAG: hypothetical protein KatS3mg015_2053 [Fimbriimonadales bacterium]